MRKHGRFERQKPRKSAGKKITLIVVGVVLALILAVILGAVMILGDIDDILGKINDVSVPAIEYTKPTYAATEAAQIPEATQSVAETTVVTEPPHVASSEDYINFLVVGQSARPGEDSRMADTMMLLTVNTYEKTLTLTSALRDTLIEIGTDYKGHSIGKIKLTTVYNLGSYYVHGDENEKIAGSMYLMNVILNKNFGIEVDHNFEVDFDMFIEVIDLMGGVTVNLTQAEADYLNAEDMWVCYDVSPGWFHLDGSGALAYARMRKAEGDSDSDVKRSARQRHLIECIIYRLKQLGYSEVKRIAEEVAPMVSTSMNSSEIKDMMVTMLQILPDLQVVSGGTCPVQDTYRGELVDIYSDGQYHSVLRFDPGQNTKLLRAITEGETN